MPQRKSRVLLKVGGILFIAACEVNTTHESNGITEQSGDQMLKRRLNGECSVPIGQVGGQGSMYRSAAGITQINHLLTYPNPHSFGATTVKTPQLLQLDMPSHYVNFNNKVWLCLSLALASKPYCFFPSCMWVSVSLEKRPLRSKIERVFRGQEHITSRETNPPPGGKPQQVWGQLNAQPSPIICPLVVTR